MSTETELTRAEISARLAILEAIVAKLLETEGRRLQRAGGKAASDSFLFSVAEAVVVRTKHFSKAELSQVDKMMNVIVNAVLESLKQDTAPKH